MTRDIGEYGDKFLNQLSLTPEQKKEFIEMQKNNIKTIKQEVGKPIEKMHKIVNTEFKKE